jgi:hypothetical protein
METLEPRLHEVARIAVFITLPGGRQRAETARG